MRQKFQFRSQAVAEVLWSARKLKRTLQQEGGHGKWKVKLVGGWFKVDKDTQVHIDMLEIIWESDLPERE